MVDCVNLFSNFLLKVELQVTYEGSRFAVNDLRLLMDTFHRVDFTGTWRRLFSRVKKHIIWGVLKSVTGMQASYLTTITGAQHSMTFRCFIRSIKTTKNLNLFGIFGQN